MNLYFILEWYLNRLNEHTFIERWETRYIGNPRRLIRISFIIYLIIVFLLTNYVTTNTNIFIGVLFFGSFGLLFAGLFVISYLRFMAKMNMRYMQIKTGTNSDIDYSNVVN